MLSFDPAKDLSAQIAAYENENRRGYDAGPFEVRNATGQTGEQSGWEIWFRDIFTIEQDWALYEFRLQEFYGNIEEYDRHLKDLERQVQLRPDSADLKFLLAYVYYFSGRFSDATDLLAQVLRLEPGFERADYFLRLARLQG